LTPGEEAQNRIESVDQAASSRLQVTCVFRFHMPTSGIHYAPYANACEHQFPTLAAARSLASDRNNDRGGATPKSFDRVAKRLTCGRLESNEMPWAPVGAHARPAATEDR